MIKTNKGIEYISEDDILYMEAEGPYTLIVKKDGKILSSKNIGELEKTLDAKTFLRIHHSFIVNLNKVNKFNKQRNGTLILENNDIIPISQRKMKTFMELYNKE